MAVDLHTHSAASDGTVAPASLVSTAASLGLAALALTDHDTLSGIADARRAAAVHGIALVPGTELSVEWPTGIMHLLVYYLEPGPGPLQDRLEGLRAGRMDRNIQIVERLGQLGYDLTMEDVLRHAHGDAVGRPHIADALVARGDFTDRDQVFAALLGGGRPAYVGRTRLGAAEAVRLARDSDALTSIAHPYTLGTSRDEYATAFTSLAAEGLNAIESHHAEHPPPLRAHLVTVASDLGLLTTGGSDYHGTGKPEIEIGSGRGDLVVPDEFHHRLEAAHAVLTGS